MSNQAILESALQKLRWGTSQRDWSASIEPVECAALLEELTAITDVNKPGESWPGEWCKRCDRRNNVGFWLSDDVWNAVVRGRWNVLCPTCFDEEAEAAGIKYSFNSPHTTIWPVLSWSDWLKPNGAVAREFVSRQMKNSPAETDDEPIVSAPTVETIHDLLLLLDDRDARSYEQISNWTSEERELVARWASLEVLAANDNPVERVPRPEVMNR
jgi:hypothetical protein